MEIKSENQKSEIENSTTDMENKNQVTNNTKSDRGKNRLSSNCIVRNIESNKLVMDCSTMNYKLRMLEGNKIPGLLPLEITENDGVKKLCYDITSREAFGSIIATRTLKMEDVRNILYGLNHILKEIEKYLLVPDELVLDKDYIYVNASDLTPQLCYLPGYNAGFAEGLSNLLQEILGAVDHNAHDAVVLAYSLYQESLKPGYVMADLIKILCDEGAEKRDNGKREMEKRDKDNALEDESGERITEKKEKTTDELFIQYQMPTMERGANKLAMNSAVNSTSASNSSISNPSKVSKTAAENRDALFAAVSKPNRRKHSTIFSR